MKGIPRKHWIYAALTFFSLLGAITKVAVLDPLGYKGLTWYLGFLYAIFLLWAIGELRKIESKEEEERDSRFESAAQVSPPTEDELMSAETYLELGESLETVCMTVAPRYRDWSPSEKQSFRNQLKAAVEERRARRPAESV